MARDERSAALAVAFVVIVLLPIYLRDAVRTAGGTPADLTLRMGSAGRLWVALGSSVALGVWASRAATPAVLPAIALLVGVAIAASIAGLVLVVEGRREPGCVRWLLRPFAQQIPSRLRGMLRWT